MLFSLICWPILTAGAAIAGSAILTAVGSPVFRHSGDRFILAAWLGLLAFATTLLGVSIFLPLRPGISFVILGSMTALAACSKKARANLKFLAGTANYAVLAGIAILAAIAALGSTRIVWAFDTGLYHYQIVRWLAEYGTVRGLALLHFRLGFSSSWFALAAPFDFGPFQGRISGLFGGLAIFLALLHFTLAMSRIFQGRGEWADWFLAGGYPLIFLVCFAWSFEVSLSPDLPIWILTLLLGWLMLLEARPPGEGKASERGDFQHILPLILAFGALSIKLSAVPLVFVAGVYFLFRSAGKLRSAFAAGAIASLLLVPFFAANFASSGCPVFPSTILCANLPWSVPKPAAQLYASYTLNSARWGTEQMPSDATAWNWIPAWFSQTDKLMLALFCGACLGGFLIFRGWRKGQPFLWVLALSLAGVAFLFFSAPNPRFGAGYFALFPGLFAAVAGPEFEKWIRIHFTSPMEQFHSISAVPIILAICALLSLQIGWNDRRIARKIEQSGHSPAPSEFHSWQRLLLPPALARFPGDLMVSENRRENRILLMQLVSERSNGIEYWRPLGIEQCWGVSLPCLAEPLEGDVGLRRPEMGLRSGFVRMSSPETAQQIR
jgi:hypothetical protein